MLLSMSRKIRWHANPVIQHSDLRPQTQQGAPKVVDTVNRILIHLS